MTDAELRQITDAITQGFKTAGAGSNNYNVPRNGSASLLDIAKDAFDPMKAIFSGAMNTAKQASSNTLSLGDAAQTVKGIFDSFGEPGRLVGSVFGTLAGVVVESIDNWRKFSGEGLNFAGNAIAFREAVMKTGLSFGEFGDSLEKLKPAMFQFGGGITAGMDAFANYSRTLNSPDLQSMLNIMGILPKEANEILALQIRMGRQNLNSTSEADMKKVVLSAVNLAQEMDTMAKLTGISRRELQKNIETMENDARVRARLATLNNDPAMRESVRAVQNAGSGLPPEVAKLLNESIAGKGVVTSERMLDLVTTYGPRAAQQMVEIGKLTTSGRKEDQARAEAMTKELFGILAQDRNKNAEFVAMQASGSAMALEAFAEKTGDAYTNYTNQLNKLMDPKGANMSEAQAKAEAYKMAQAQSKGMITEDMKVMINGVEEILRAKDEKTGEYNTKDPRAIGTQLVVDAQGVLRTVGAETNKVITSLNNSIPKFIKDKDGTIELDPETEKMIVQSQQAVMDKKNVQSAIPGMLKDVHALFTTTNTTFKDLPANLETAMTNAFKKLFPGRAAGGSVDSGMPYVVGEGGAEMFMPKVDGMIQNNISSALGNPNLSAILKNIPAMVSSGSQQVEQAVTQMAQAMPDSNLMIEKLDQISSIMASVDRSMKDAVGHANETAKNTREMGGVVA
jgi:hypothetical protein